MKKIIGMTLIILLSIIFIFVFSFENNKKTNTNVTAGEKIYTQMCASCHGTTGLGEGKYSGTALNNQLFLSSVSNEDLFNYVKFGREKANMPKYDTSLKDEEIKKVVAFMRSWQTEETKLKAPDNINGDFKNGEKLYGLYCLSCHGEAGLGKMGMGTAVADPDYLKYTSDQQIWIGTAYGREHTRMGPSLKGLEGVRQLKKQEISDIVIYLRNLQEKK